MSELSYTLVFSAVSAALMALGCFVKPLGRVCGVLVLLWLAAVLPLLFFLNVSWQYVMLFYLISAAVCLVLNYGGKPQ
jgi:hypothetical protein